MRTDNGTSNKPFRISSIRRSEEDENEEFAMNSTKIKCLETSLDKAVYGKKKKKRVRGDLYTLYKTNSQGPQSTLNNDYIDGSNERSSYSILQDNHSLQKQSAKIIKTLNTELRQFNRMRNSID